jgi:hypothetical protein
MGAKSIGQRSKSVAEIQGPFDTFAMTTRKRLDAVIKTATNTRYIRAQTHSLTQKCPQTRVVDKIGGNYGGIGRAG